MMAWVTCCSCHGAPWGECAETKGKPPNGPQSAFDAYDLATKLGCDAGTDIAPLRRLFEALAEMTEVERAARSLVHPSSVEKTSDPERQLTWLNNARIEALRAALARLDEVRGGDPVAREPLEQ